MDYLMNNFQSSHEYPPVSKIGGNRLIYKAVKSWFTTVIGETDPKYFWSTLQRQRPEPKYMLGVKAYHD